LRSDGLSVSFQYHQLPSHGQGVMTNRDDQVENQDKLTSRRQFIRVVTIGGIATAVLLPGSWKRPIIDAVVVPAHAAASDVPVTSTVPPTTVFPTTPPPSTQPPPPPSTTPAPTTTIFD
jgi:hypothetical protein